MTEAYRVAMMRAGAAVHGAITKGVLPRLKRVEVLCVDCKKARAQCYDHRDYNRPLDVEPVCYRCNLHRGPAAYTSPPGTPKSFPNIRTAVFQIRLCSKEKAIICRAARREKMSISDFVRGILLPAGQKNIAMLHDTRTSD